LEEPDIVPIHSLGYDRTRQGYADFVNSPDRGDLKTIIDGVGDIAEIRWWNADAWQNAPVYSVSSELYPSPAGRDDCDLHSPVACIENRTIRTRTHSWQQATSLVRRWSFQDLRDRSRFYGTRTGSLQSASTMEKITLPEDGPLTSKNYPYVFPMAWLTLSMHEALYEGVTPRDLLIICVKIPGSSTC